LRVDLLRDVDRDRKADPDIPPLRLRIALLIPINVAKKIYAELAAKGKVSRGWLGVSVQELNEDLAKSFNANAGQGVLVADVVDGSPAAKSGVQAGDVILEFDGKKIESPVDLQRAVGLTQPGSAAKVKLMREKREQTVDVKIAEVPDDLQARAGRGKDLLGLEIKPVTPDLARQLGLRSTEGVVVASVDDGSPAEAAGVRPGDVVREVNRQRIRTVSEFSKAIQGLKPGDRVMLTLQRAGSSLFVAFTLGRG
ncbi:MAG: PDZ domain-containing protein, partial [Candidatus Rokubacteria bacterium]|nr:PDZ domain-containing protein [Candidatus Rokubacteria bacterium]